MQPGLSDYGQRDLIVQTLAWQIAGLVLIVCHVQLVKLSPAFYPVVIVLVGWLFARASLAGLLVFWQVLLFQNIVISLFSSDMDFPTFNALQGTNFFILVALAGVSAIRLLPVIFNQHRAIAISMIVALVLTLLYTTLGALKSGLTSAIVYFREFAGPIFSGIIGIEVGRVWGFCTVGLCFLYGAVLSVLLNVVEYFYPISYYGIINEVQFLQLKNYYTPIGNTFYTPEDIVNAYTSVFFNITGALPTEYGLNSFRFGGTIVNPISNGYIIAVLAITAVAVKRSLYLIFLLPMLIMVGVKGANVLLVSSLSLYIVWAVTRSRRLLLVVGAGLSAIYIAAGVSIGLRNNDFHMLGFMGGVNSLVHNPIGHGLGVGGNLSAGANRGIKWTGTGGFQSMGVDFALESAVGVLIYQMGIAAIAVLGVFWTFIWEAPLGLSARRDLPCRSDVIFFALAMVVLNGVFQEEAFAPYAAGTIMLLSGVLTGNQHRLVHVLCTGRRNKPAGAT